MHPEEMPILQPLPIPTLGLELPKRLKHWIFSIRKWQVAADWHYTLPGNRPHIIIPKGFKFDGASIPRALWGILSPTGLLLIPGLIHDFGYRYDYLWALDEDGALYKYGKGKGQHFWDLLFRDVGEAVNGMKVIDRISCFTLTVAGRMAWRSNRKRNEPEIQPSGYCRV